MNRRLSAVHAIIAVNIAVFSAWIYFEHQTSDPSFMIKNFLISWNSVADGRVWTVLTSVFSHNMFWHLFMNMYVLSGFGPIIESLIGSVRFTQFYLLAGAISSLAHAFVSSAIIGNPDLPALGASGSISGVVLLFSLIFPKQKILIFGIIPMPAAIGALLLIGLDAWGLIAQAEGGGLPIGHGAHLGGALTGIAYYLFVIRPALKRMSAASKMRGDTGDERTPIEGL